MPFCPRQKLRGLLLLLGLLVCAAPATSAWAKKPSWITAGGVVVNPQGEFLLVQSKREMRKDGTNGWTWPKGKLERGMNKQMTALRETLEEGGVEARIESKLLQLRSRRAKRHYYLMRLTLDHQTHDHEILNTGWYSYKAAKKLIQRPRDRKVLKAAHRQLKRTATR